MRAFLLLTFLAVFVHGQQAQPDPDKKKIRVEGRVVALNGEAVRKATVRLQGAFNLQLNGPAPATPPPNYSETTDDAGKFTFEDVAEGRYNLTSEKTGFVTQRYGARSDTSPGTQLDLHVGDQLKDLALKMTPQAVLSGQVTDQDGDPVANVQVSVYRYAYSNGHRQLMPGGGPPAGGGGRGGPGGGPGAGATDDQGNYRISNLPPGRYYVNANPRGGNVLIPTQERPGRSGGAPQATSITTFYPNAIDVTGAVPVDVVAGGRSPRHRHSFAQRARVFDPREGGGYHHWWSSGGRVRDRSSVGFGSSPGSPGSFALGFSQRGSGRQLRTPRPFAGDSRDSGIGRRDAFDFVQRRAGVDDGPDGSRSEHGCGDGSYRAHGGYHQRC